MNNSTSLPGLPFLGLVWLLALTTPPCRPSPPANPPHLSPCPTWPRSRRTIPGDGLSVAPTPEGARLRCVFQKLEGRVTSGVCG